MILSIEGENGIALYKASLPDEVYYPQRRKSTRITLHSTINIPFQATMAGGATLFHGRLTNLSLGGLAFFIPFSEALTLGDELRDCKITLPDGEDIQFMFSVRYVKSLPRENKTVIGGCFTAIGYEDYKAIERYLDAFVSDRLGTT
jgi:c-di-GMP-binding flagellar brake protein YcgR